MANAFFTEAASDDARRGVRPPLRPSWLLPTLALFVITAHACFFAAFMIWVRPQWIPFSTIDAEIVRDGDFVDTPAVAESALEETEEDTQQQQLLDEPEFALPPPLVMEPDSPALAEKREATEKSEKAGDKRDPRRDVARGAEIRDAQAARRAGAPGGRGAGGGATRASCLAVVAASMRSHMPGATSLGPGSAYVTFHVNPGGGVSGVTVSASSPAHAALARRIVAASRGPASCMASFASQRIVFE